MEENRYQDFLKQVGANVRQARNEKGFSMERLANAADMEIRQLGRIERGEINTTITSLKKIADALDIKVDSFLIV